MQVIYRLAALALLGLSSMLITACQPAEPGVSPAAQTAPEAQPATQAKTPAAVYARFNSELQACHALVKVVATDRPFVEAFQSAKVRSSQPVDALLRKSSVARTPEVEYFLNQGKYMVLDVDFHVDPWGVAWVPNEAIYCALNFEVISDIEALGESEEAWSVRLFFLDRALENLSPPGDESPGGMVPYDRFKTYVLEASKLYTNSQKSAFRSWLDKAIKTVDESRKGIEDGAAGLTSQQQQQMLDERLAFLRQLAQPAK
jgi:hypothetical protein